MNLIITGSAGYIAGILIEKFSADPSIETIIGIDLLPRPDHFAANSKLKWVQADLAERKWEEQIPAGLQIDGVIHCAYKIRNPYGKTKATEENNVNACRNVFAFSFEKRIPKLVYLASVAAYGAKPENIGKLLREDDLLVEKENPYGYQKAQSEKILHELMAEKKPSTKIFVLRLNSVTGPRGQSLSSKFGLITFLRKLLPFVIEANPHWARQFVHEEDVAQIIYNLTTKNISAGTNPAIFNVAPATFLTARDMAKLLQKSVLKLPASTIRPLFAIAWHLTHGKIPTPPEAAKGLIYPINVDGTKVERDGIHRYRYSPEEALLGKTK